MNGTSQTVDVAVVGGGPAGSAAALTVKARMPDSRVVLLEASRYEAFRVGEVLPAAARGLLVHLGCDLAALDRISRPAPALVSAWESDQAVESHALFSARGPGWHLDRRAFDAWLADTAAAAGVEVGLGQAVTGLRRSNQGWTLEVSDGFQITAHQVIWAAGRHRGLAREVGAKVITADHLIAHFRVFEQPVTGDPRFMVEAAPEGWWYTVPLPDHRRLVACLTDADIAGGLNLRSLDAWHALLSRTRHVAAAAGDTGRECLAAVRAAGSTRLEPPCGDGWIAAGDAAYAFDPLSSQGITKALRSGIFAGYAAFDCLSGQSEPALTRHAALIRREFLSYRTLQARFYQSVRRWPDQPFWSRRAPESAEFSPPASPLTTPAPDPGMP